MAELQQSVVARGRVTTQPKGGNEGFQSADSPQAIERYKINFPQNDRRAQDDIESIGRNMSSHLFHDTW